MEADPEIRNRRRISPHQAQINMNEAAEEHALQSEPHQEIQPGNSQEHEDNGDDEQRGPGEHPEMRPQQSPGAPEALADVYGVIPGCHTLRVQFRRFPHVLLPVFTVVFFSLRFRGGHRRRNFGKSRPSGHSLMPDEGVRLNLTRLDQCVPLGLREGADPVRAIDVVPLHFGAMLLRRGQNASSNGLLKTQSQN